jgi:hypothetical protein
MPNDASLLAKIGALLAGKNAEQVGKVLEELVSKNSPVLKPVWLTVKLGTFKSGQWLLEAMHALGFLFGAWAEKLLSSPDFIISKQERELDLVELSVGEDLGFKDGALWSKILEKIVEMGYEICPAEVGPLLRMKHDKQVKGELRWVAMQLIKAGVYFRVFCVFHDGDGRWLDARDFTNRDFIMYSNGVVLAVRPRTVS